MGKDDGCDFQRKTGIGGWEIAHGWFKLFKYFLERIWRKSREKCKSFFKLTARSRWSIIEWYLVSAHLKFRTDLFKLLNHTIEEQLNPHSSYVESSSKTSFRFSLSLSWILSPALPSPPQTYKSYQTKTSWNFKTLFVTNLKRLQFNNVYMPSFSSSISIILSSVTLQQKLT